MTDNTTIENTSDVMALRPRKRPVRSFFDYFGGKTLRLNNDLGAMAIFFFDRFS